MALLLHDLAVRSEADRIQLKENINIQENLI